MQSRHSRTGARFSGRPHGKPFAVDLGRHADLFDLDVVGLTKPFNDPILSDPAQTERIIPRLVPGRQLIHCLLYTSDAADEL